MLLGTRSAAVPYDYFHVNAISLDADGGLLVSARGTWTVYKLDRATHADPAACASFPP